MIRKQGVKGNLSLIFIKNSQETKKISLSMRVRQKVCDETTTLCEKLIVKF